ncbi:MAG: hypothetical protein L6R42_001021 [Xanthoria sp. 1 TBL-2021]|nr:MAG: hypothetical protein L6R42_001021 [Xanthoria sp. 1 TBL-2021]
MPKHTNTTRGGSTRRRDVTSDEKKDQEPRPSTDLILSHGNTEGSRTSTAILASSNGAIQRLAAFTQYFESSFTSDMDMVERVYGTEVDKEAEIQRLTEAVETLSNHKREQMENLRRENEELLNGQEACARERNRYRTMQEELEAQNAEAEADREEEYKRKLQEEKDKTQKRIKTSKAEIEAESKARFRELGDQNAELSAMNEQLKQRLSGIEKKLEAKKARHARLEKSLEEDNKKLSAELKQLKSEFPVEGQPVDAEKFQHISDAIKVVSSRYFQKLPERALTHPEAVQQDLSKLSPIFDSTPIWQTEISDFLRLKDVQHVISTCLCDFIWQPFPLQENLPNREVVGPFLEAVSNSLSASGGRSESAWRVLTLRGIDDLGGESSGVEPMMHRVLEILQPLTVPSESAGLENDLFKIINESITLWKAARKDEARFIVEKNPDPSDKENWQAEDTPGIENVSIPLDKNLDTSSITPLCIFPNILQTTSGGESIRVHQGSALFPTSPVWIQAVLEKKEHEEELAKAVSDARWKVNARRMSSSAGPNSPVKERFS